MSDQRRQSAARNQDNLSGSKKLKFFGDKFSNFKLGRFVPKKLKALMQWVETNPSNISIRTCIFITLWYYANG